MKILVINAGSSSMKYQVMDMENESVLAKGNFERIGQAEASLTHKVNGEKYFYELRAKDHEEAMKYIIDKLLDDQVGVLESLDELGGIAHRIVHGGENLREACIVTEEVVQEIDRVAPMAPLHNKAAIAGIRACQKLAPNIKMVTVFDTGFHRTIPEERFLYAIPYEYYEKHSIRKYGFHGMSHQYVSSHIAEVLGKDIKNLKIVNCHLGQGASLAAIQGGECVETTMGLTPLGGLCMGSRSGDLDPSVVTYLMKKLDASPEEMDKILNKESGIYGISELSLDFRDVERAYLAGEEQSVLALDIFDYIVAENIAKCAVAMNGIDVITFTAGVGERGAVDRKHICRQLKVFGVEIDEELNKQAMGEEMRISTPDSKIDVWVVPTNEELMIARETYKLVK